MAGGRGLVRLTIRRGSACWAAFSLSNRRRKSRPHSFARSSLIVQSSRRMGSVMFGSSHQFFGSADFGARIAALTFLRYQRRDENLKAFAMLIPPLAGDLLVSRRQHIARRSRRQVADRRCFDGHRCHAEKLPRRNVGISLGVVLGCSCLAVRSACGAQWAQQDCAPPGGSRRMIPKAAGECWSARTCPRFLRCDTSRRNRRRK